MNMILDVDFLISFFEKLSSKTKNSELGEQDAPPSAGSTPGAGGASSGKTVKKWDSGLARGKSNQIGVTKWESGRKFGKTYMNDPKYVWKTDRQIGKTGGSDFV